MTSCGARPVDRIDRASDSVVAQAETPIADSECSIAAGEGAVWLADREGSSFPEEIWRVRLPL